MTDYRQYWAANTFEMHRRVQTIKDLLKLDVPIDTPFVRLGSATDGGYVLVDDLTSNDILISMGVEQNVDFEVDISQYIKESYLYDYSVSGTPVPVPNSQFFMSKIGAGEFDTSIYDCLSAVPSRAENDFILKMDIEGSEFETIAAASTEDLAAFRQITIEAHWMQNLWDENFYAKAVEAFANLRQTHTPVMVHANNNVPLMVLGNSPVPMVFEVLYLRTDDYFWRGSSTPFDGLITRNDPHFPEIGLTFP
jgi:hypothetical protein